MSTIQSSAEHLTLNADGTSKDIKLQSNASEKVIIKSDGNVGLGTSSPDSLLEIYKASTAELMIGSDNGGTAQISLYENNSTTKEATIKYDGFANNLVIGTSGQANAIVIPRDSGIVTMPSQPAFSVTKTSDQSITTAADRQITWETEEFDVGSNFASNIFTAPITGTYFLHAMVRIDNVDTAASYYRTGIQSSNKTKYEIIRPLFTADVAYISMSVASIFDMDAGDTAEVTVRQQGGTDQVHIDDTISYTNFCGYLLG